MSNALLLTELLLQYAVKAQEIAILFREADGKDITDEQLNASKVARDAAVLKARKLVDVG